MCNPGFYRTVVDACVSISFGCTVCRACTVCSGADSYVVSECQEDGDDNDRVCGTYAPPAPPPSCWRSLGLPVSIQVATASAYLSSFDDGGVQVGARLSATAEQRWLIADQGGSVTIQLSDSGQSRSYLASIADSTVTVVAPAEDAALDSAAAPEIASSSGPCLVEGDCICSSNFGACTYDPLPLAQDVGSAAWCEAQAQLLGLTYQWQSKSNGAPAGCVQYNSRVVFVETCTNHVNCDTNNCNGCTVLHRPAANNNEECAVNFTQPATLNAYYFQTEACLNNACDRVTVDGNGYSGSTFPNGVVASSLTWSTDASVQSGGFKICLSDPKPLCGGFSKSMPVLTSPSSRLQVEAVVGD